VAALARPLLVIPRDDADAPATSGACGHTDDGAAAAAATAVDALSPHAHGAPLPPTMPLQFAAVHAKPAEAAVDTRRAAIALGCSVAPPLLGEGVVAARPLLATLSLLHSLGGGVQAEATCDSSAPHALVGEALRALAAACELAE
jgi:hypothetical protein